MVKNNEYVGVDDKYIPEGEQRKTPPTPLKIAKGVGYYMAIRWVIGTILAIGIFILSIVIGVTIIGQMQRTQKEYSQRRQPTEEKVLDITDSVDDNLIRQ